MNKSYAQVDTSTTQKLLQYIFQPVDKTQIPTGFLEEYGCPMLPMETFNGTLTDSNRIDMHLWRTLYFQLQTSWSRTASNPLPTIITTNTTIRQNVADTVPTPIPILIGQYNTVKSNAFTGNLLSYNSGTRQVSDVPGRSQSPYNTRNLFAACANKKQSLTGSESFIIKSNLIWNNTAKTVNQIQIDFANGQGFQTVTIGTPFSVSYTDTGYKRWTIKATLSDNSVLQCYNDYYVLKASGVGYRYAGNESVIPSWGFVNVNSGATIHINYSQKSYTGTLRKPLIVVEGYDVSHIAPDLQDNYRSRDFIDAITLEPVGYDFNGQLDDQAGYDLVFIDFTDGAADIVDNAAIVQEVINRVNDHKVNDDRFDNIRQQNVVMGLSMGGLCARYALANMTKNFPGMPTETRLLITHDSPHRGANIPLGLQYFIRMVGNFQLFGYNVYDIYPEYDDALKLLGAPATQQLLKYTSTSTNTYSANTFLGGTYRNMITFAQSDPIPSYRFIASSLGSECAHPLFSPGKTFFNFGAGVGAGIDARLLFFRIPILSYRLSAQGSAYALPNQGTVAKLASLTTINQLTLFGFINIYKQLYNGIAFSTGNELPIDGVAGSNYPLLDFEGLQKMQDLPIFSPIGISVNFPIGTFLGAYFDVWAYNQGFSYDFTFVPVASALDAAPYNDNIFSQKYVNGENQFFPSTSETFIAQETNTSAGTTNNAHIRFTARNSRWLFNEMENLSNLENCSSECSNPYYIQGDDLFCATSENFSIPGLPRGASVEWSVSPVGIASIGSPHNIETNLTKILNGVVTLAATITNSCSTSPVTITKQIAVGKAQPGSITFLLIDPVMGKIQARVESVPGATSYNWYKNNVLISGPAYHNNFIQFPISKTKCDIEYDISVEAINICGTSLRTHANAYVPCDYYFMISPNPATNTITISAAKDKSHTVSSAPSITQVSIYDNLGNVKKQQSFSKVPSATLQLSRLKNGVYFVEISDGEHKERHQVIIAK